MDDIKWLEEWYQKQCDGNWEHLYGINIDTLDNPGWTVKINLRDTRYEYYLFDELRLDYGDDDWIVCFVEDRVFHGIGDSGKLSRIIQIFREWIEKSTEIK